MNRILVALCATVVGLGVPRAVVQQQVPNIPPVAPAIAKVYDKDADGAELFQVRSVVIEPVSGALWVQFGKESDPPLRIDRRTGSIKVIGRVGAGPNEYMRIIAMVPGIRGDVGIWDPARRLWFWVDSAGIQRRTWSIPTNSLGYDRIFSDARGNVWISQPLSGDWTNSVAVRVDSANGLRDSIQIPLQNSGKWSWNAVGVSGTSRGSSGTMVSYAPNVVWGIDGRGRVFAAWSDSTFVVIRDGASSRRLQLLNYEETLSSDEKASAAQRLDQFEQNARRQGMQLQGARPAIPERRPTISAVRPEMNGGIAVVRSRTCGDMPDWRAPGSRAAAADPKARCAFVERFDAEGRRLRPFTLQLGDQLRAIRGDTAWVTRSNADGLERIIELVIPKG